LERDVADARAQVAATVDAEKKSIERAKAADKKVEEAKIVVSAAKQEAAALHAKIKGLTAELSAATAQLQQTSGALAEETRLRRQCTDELEALRLQVVAGTSSLQAQLQSADSARAQSQAQAEEFRGAARVLQEEVQEARAAVSAQQALLQVKLAEAKVAIASQNTDLKQRLSASENLCSVHQQQHQQECARQERERKFIEQKLEKLEEQQMAAAASESAAATAQAAAEHAAAAANECIAAVSAVFKKMANLDEGLEGDCTCMQCMQALADPVLLQVRALPAPLFTRRCSCTCSAVTRCVQAAPAQPALAPSAMQLSNRCDRRASCALLRAPFCCCCCLTRSTAEANEQHCAGHAHFQTQFQASSDGAAADEALGLNAIASSLLFRSAQARK
jgi:hypothetical protein